MILGEDESYRNVVHFGLIVRFVPLELLNNPKTTIWLLFIRLHDQLLTESIIKIPSGIVSLRISPVENLLIQSLALGEFLIKLGEVGIWLASSNVN